MTDPRMRAVIFSGEPPDRDVVVDMRPVPTPGTHEILVRVRAAALNRADLSQLGGGYAPPPGVPEDMPGLEFAGEVVGLGGGVRRWQVGDRVCGIVNGAAQAEYLVTHEALAASVPDGMDWASIAALPEAFVTAADALWLQAALAPGDRVLVHAVASGVGLAAIQLARIVGAEPLGVTRTADKLPIAREVGLAHGMVTSDPEVAAAWARDVTGGRGVDVVLDLVGGAWTGAALKALALRGRLILVGVVGGRSTEVGLGTILSRRLTIRGTVLRARPLEEKIAAAKLLEQRLLPLFVDGRLTPTIDSVHPLNEAAAAYERLGSNTTAGKVVLMMDDVGDA